MEIEEEVYKVGNTPKNTNRSEFESASHGRKLKVGEAASPTNPEKGRSGKHNTNKIQSDVKESISRSE